MFSLHMSLSFQDQMVLRGRWVLQGQKVKMELRANSMEMDQHGGNPGNLGNQVLKASKESQGLQVIENNWSCH